MEVFEYTNGQIKIGECSKDVYHLFESANFELFQQLGQITTDQIWTTAITKIKTNFQIEYEYYPLKFIYDKIKIKEARVYNLNVNNACYIYEFNDKDELLLNRLTSQYLYIGKINGYERYNLIENQLVDCYDTTKENIVFNNQTDIKTTSQFLDQLEEVEQCNNRYGRELENIITSETYIKTKVLTLKCKP